MSPPKGKIRGFTTYGDPPFNGGPPLESLCTRRVTPVSRHFVRSHGPVPRIALKDFSLRVCGLVENPQPFSLGQLKREFPLRRKEVALECAGNRRKELSAVEQVFGEVPWGPEAIGNALWGGLWLRELLVRVGLRPGARHVAFTGLDDAKKGDERSPFGGSIPLSAALRGGALLAYEMNRRPLTPAHGAPLRAVVPGFIGARSVKWLGTIEILASPSTNPFHSRTYKLVPRGATPGQWAAAPPLGPTRVNCAICVPADGSKTRGEHITVRGYAHGGGGSQVTRVEVSGDGGRTWSRARTPRYVYPGAWTLWSARLAVSPGPVEIVARCVDTAGRRQPASLKAAWNPGGYQNNAWHRIRVTALRGARRATAPARTHP